MAVQVLGIEFYGGGKLLKSLLRCVHLLFRSIYLACQYTIGAFGFGNYRGEYSPMQYPAALAQFTTIEEEGEQSKGDDSKYHTLLALEKQQR